MRTEIKDNRVIAYPEGKIDSGSAATYQDEFLKIVEDNPGKALEVNMEGIEYVSSAGLRIFLKLQKSGCGLKLTEVKPAVYDVFQMTDFTEIIDIKKALRRIDVDGCEIIGQGYFGTVYRIDEDTIVKAYSSPDYIPMIENEKLRAKQAFMAGIPTAIPYDVVRVGDSYGLVFEMLKAKTFNDLVKEDPNSLSELIDKYVDFIKLIHSTTMESASLPYAKDIFRGYVDLIREKQYLPDDMCDTLAAYFDAMPVDDHVAHGDIQMKNIMMVDGEPMLIDMDTIMAGSPIFDFGALMVTYRLFSEDLPGNNLVFLGISDETADYIAMETFNRYYSDRSEAEKEDIFNKIEIVARIRFIFLLITGAGKDEEIEAKRKKRAIERFKELFTKVDRLY